MHTHIYQQIICSNCVAITYTFNDCNKNVVKTYLQFKNIVIIVQGLRSNTGKGKCIPWQYKRRVDALAKWI